MPFHLFQHVAVSIIAVPVIYVVLKMLEYFKEDSLLSVSKARA